MPSTSSRCFQETSYSDQLDVVVADQVQQETFHGLHFLLGKTSPLQPALHEGLQGGAAHDCQEELQDCGQVMNKKSKVINSCGGSVLQDLHLE